MEILKELSYDELRDRVFAKLELEPIDPNQPERYAAEMHAVLDELHKRGIESGIAELDGDPSTIECFVEAGVRRVVASAMRGQDPRATMLAAAEWLGA